MATKKIEDAIRSYLDNVGVSQKPVVDREAVKALIEQIKSETDAIAKLRLLAALEEEQAGRAADTEGYTAVFVAESKAWADAEGIPVSAFQALNVPDDILLQAGFEIAESARSSSAGGARSTAGTRAPRIPLDEVAAAAKKLGSGWKLADLAETRIERRGPSRTTSSSCLRTGRSWTWAMTRSTTDGAELRRSTE